MEGICGFYSFEKKLKIEVKIKDESCFRRCFLFIWVKMVFRGWLVLR